MYFPRGDAWTFAIPTNFRGRYAKTTLLEVERELGVRDPCCPRRFRSESTQVAWRRLSSIGLLFAFILVFVGCAVPAFTAHIKLPDGVGVDFVHTHSIWGFAWSLPMACKPFVFWGFAVLVIHIHCGFLVAADFLRLSPAWRVRANTVTHTLFAWAATDVMVVAMFFTLIDMSQANLLPSTPYLLSIFSAIAQKPIVDEKALIIEVDLRFGAFMVTAGVVLHTLFARSVMGALERVVVLQKRDQQAEALIGSCQYIDEVVPNEIMWQSPTASTRSDIELTDARNVVFA